LTLCNNEIKCIGVTNSSFEVFVKRILGAPLYIVITQKLFAIVTMYKSLII
jgi:hypothetical protein